MLNFLITDLRLAYPIRHTAQKAASPGFFLLPHTPSKGERKALFLLDNNRGCLCLNFNGARYLETSMCTQEKKNTERKKRTFFRQASAKGAPSAHLASFPFILFRNPSDCTPRHYFRYGRTGEKKKTRALAMHLRIRNPLKKGSFNVIQPPFNTL